MNKSIFFTSLAVLVSITFFLMACTNPQGTQVQPISTTQTEPIPNMANPAAVYCEGLGYSMETVTRDGGQDADCLFPDGTRCGQWDFLAGRCGEEYSYCSLQGFSLESSDANIGNCRFPDGSYCPEYEYFSGSCAPGDNP